MICAYHDHADEEEVETSPISEKDAEAESSTSSEQVFFPVKLHTMLTHMGKEGADNGKHTMATADIFRNFNLNSLFRL